MAEVDTEKLEYFLNKATNPFNQSEDWDSIMAFCKQVNDELEGPQIGVRLIAHKIQSPQEKEALYGLLALEACVKNCGPRFHQEIGKFRFLNEVIKVISPKYLGNYTKESVKKRCIELMYTWSLNLKNEPKISEAYSMLKHQGLITKDPVCTDLGSMPPPPPKKDTIIFDDEEKSKLLAKLLKSKHPEDLQAANRLIKNMVKQDAERMEKASRRLQQLETTTNNMKLLNEMMMQYAPGITSQSEEEVMKELWDNLEKQRPILFRLASDTEEKDTDAIGQVLKVNDELVNVLKKYESLMNTSSKPDVLLDSTGHRSSNLGTSADSLLGLDDGSSSSSSASADPWSAFSSPVATLSSDTIKPVNSLGNSKPKSDMQELGDIFSSVSSSHSTQSKASNDLLGDSHFNGFSFSNTTLPPQLGASSIPQMGVSSVPLLPSLGPQSLLSSSIRPQTTVNSTSSFQLPSPSTAPRPPINLNTGPSSPVHVSWTSTATSTSQNKTGATSVAKTGGRYDCLDELGKTVMQQAKSSAKPSSSEPDSALNGGDRLAGFGDMVEALPPVPLAGSKQSSVEILPLTDVFVPLETIQPGSLGPVTVYEKHGVRVVVHVGKDRPRPDVQVMVVSVMSTNSSPVRKFSFQAAVPKVMKLKLQTASALDLPAYNPILPPAAITQVMLIANPLKEKIRLKFKVMFTLDSGDITDTGDINDFPTLT